MQSNSLVNKLTLGRVEKSYVDSAAELFGKGQVSYTAAPADVVATGIGLPYVSGKFSLGIGNTDTTGSNATGIPLWGIFSGDHTTAYYKDKDVIDFLKIEDKDRKKIKNYQNKVWRQMGPKTKVINFSNSKIIESNQEDK
ncbi:hypothetical protein EV697_10826 [Bisgaardia hudsonensis]|uniref:Uncharacterized protein n=1 Tax=Bisgaardia hudsonensis TaxID=109472 RepID=A0A4V2SIV2_9PAST|nr:hypothetical protein [Bisgaardia hudsonensis]QLB12889.1 hypothetical protein A6A11_04330 [Bisgaardia hudsonensis]TCP11303.1 hypothetical protein EV697_10826 [Bisgaardia hudsonensis]